jgi:hypothetical protein
MENLSATMPNCYQSQIPVASTILEKSVSPAKSAVPAWAAPLEKALAEDIRKESVQCDMTMEFPLRTDTTRKASVPPHMRNKGILADVVSASQCNSTQGPGLDTAAKVHESHFSPSRKNVLIGTSRALAFKALVNEEDKLNDEALAWKIATADLGARNVKQVSVLGKMYF